MTVTLKRVAGVLTLAIPDEVAKAAGFSDDTEVSLSSTTTGEVVAKRKSKYSLAELLARVTPENKHEYIDSGPPVGNEVL